MRRLLAIVLLALGAGCSRPVQGNGRNVLLVTLETTRADHVSAYGYARKTTPNFDAWASTGALFERHHTVSPRTNPSLASLLTSTYPHEHGTRNILMPLEPESRTLAEILREAGYRTGAVQTHPRLVKRSGFEQGFDDYLDDFRAHPLAEQSLGEAWRWIVEASREDRPWFLWVHVMDPHWTYDPPERWRSAFGPDDPRPRQVYDDLSARRRTIGPLIFQNRMPPDEISAFVNLYDAELRYTDDSLGKLLAAMAEKGLDRKTLVVVTADHGESLGEQQYFFEHGDLGTQAEIAIPFAVALPGSIAPGTRVPFSTRSLDVAPTVLDFAGLPADGRFRGVSVRPLLEGTERADRPCLGETDRSLHEEAASRRELEGIAGKRRWVRLGRFKLVHVPRMGAPAERLLFDVESDPGETTDLAASHPEVVFDLARRLDAWLSEDTQQDRDYHISPELREALRSLGYIN
ncbi:MAG TPA: sulfatase [Candidatus Polarisedimenticolaceae bacterium]